MRVPPFPHTFEPEVLELPRDLEFDQALLALRERPGLVALDSAGGRPAHYSWIAFDPVQTLTGLESLEQLRDQLAGWQVTSAIPGPFAGGFLGALAYDLGVTGEALRLPEEPWGWPKIIGGLYTRFLVFDHDQGTRYLVLPKRPQCAAEAEQLQYDLQTSPHAKPFGMGELRRQTDSQTHQERIEVARDEIAAGEYYQVNLAHRFTAPMQGDPVDLYLRLRRANPAPYGAYLRFEGGACLSTSPELLLSFDGESVFTRPIKGTAPRSQEEGPDQEAREALLASEKDRAELAMIVDLERNDLGRIAQPGSVRVDAFPELETYARVHHLVATVRAKPRAGVQAIDLLHNLFPGGSITGAPKLASMEAIARLEQEGRGLFTGSLGFLDFRGRALFNVLIRTVLWRPLEGDRGEISYRVGGGITYASNAQDEDLETLHKAQGMTDAWT